MCKPVSNAIHLLKLEAVCDGAFDRHDSSDRRMRFIMTLWGCSLDAVVPGAHHTFPWHPNDLCTPMPVPAAGLYPAAFYFQPTAKYIVRTNVSVREPRIPPGNFDVHRTSPPSSPLYLQPPRCDFQAPAICGVHV